MLRELLKIFNAAYNTSECVPVDLQKGVICPLLKKGEKVVCHNYRGVTVLSHCAKIYNRIIEKRLRSCLEEKLQESQYGFRPGRGTSDLIFTVKMILEKSWEWDISRMALLIDMEKAFDRVRRNDLFNIMLDEYYNIPRKLIRIVKNMYSVCVGKVKGAGVESDWFNIESGVRQGDVLSPLFFVIFMNRCLRDAQLNNEMETI